MSFFKSVPYVMFAITRVQDGGVCGGRGVYSVLGGCEGKGYLLCNGCVKGRAVYFVLWI
jgi:hypothetical protein